MSRSFNVSFTQTLKATVSDDFIFELRTQFAKVVEIISAIPVEKRLSEQKVALSRCTHFLSLDDDTMILQFTKQAFRDGFRDEIIENLKQAAVKGMMEFSKFAPALVTVTSRES